MRIARRAKRANVSIKVFFRLKTLLYIAEVASWHPFSREHTFKETDGKFQFYTENYKALKKLVDRPPSALIARFDQPNAVLQAEWIKSAEELVTAGAHQFPEEVAKNLLRRQSDLMRALYATSGYPNRATVDRLILSAVFELAPTDFEVCLYAPESVRYEILKHGILNRHSTGTTQGEVMLTGSAKIFLSE